MALSPSWASAPACSPLVVLGLIPSSLSGRAAYLGYRLGAFGAQRVPRSLDEHLCKVFGRVFAARMSGRAAMIERHLRRVHGDELQGAALRSAVDAAFDSYARYWLESFSLPRETPESLDAHFETVGLDHLDDALRAGKGAILALPHLGAWDFGGAWLTTHGYPLTVVVEKLEPAELFEWFVEHRRSIGMEVIPLDPRAGTVVVRALRAGHLVALLCDRDLTDSGVEVELFGERTTMPSGPATLALRTGAPILPTTAYFRPRGGHLGVVRPPIPVYRQGKLREDVARITQLLAYELEALIREAPEQWHLMQPNWPSDFEFIEELRKETQPGSQSAVGPDA